MNPYLQASLEPQIAEAQRQAQIQQVANASRLNRAGAYGGSRQAIMDSESQRNLYVTWQTLHLQATAVLMIRPKRSLIPKKTGVEPHNKILMFMGLEH